MPFRLIPREAKFHDLLEELSSRLPMASTALLSRGPMPPGSGDPVDRMIVALDESFITPFDREDLYRLASTLEGVGHAIEAIGDHLAATGAGPDDLGVGPALRAVHECCTRLDAAVRALREAARNADDLRRLPREVVALTREADRSLRAGLADLDTVADRDKLAAVLRRRDLDLALRTTINACREAGRAVTVIVVKGA